jgi:aminopeptidase C
MHQICPLINASLLWHIIRAKIKISFKEVMNMNVEVRRELSPQEFIRQLFAETKDGKVSMEYAPFFDEPYTMTYDMDWSAET